MVGTHSGTVTWNNRFHAYRTCLVDLLSNRKKIQLHRLKQLVSLQHLTLGFKGWLLFFGICLFNTTFEVFFGFINCGLYYNLKSLSPLLSKKKKKKGCK